MFENLNFRPHNAPRIFKVIKDSYPKLLPVYEKIKRDPTEWNLMALQIKSYCDDLKLNYKIEFHHGGFSKS